MEDPREVLGLICGTPVEDREIKVGDRELVEEGEKVEILDIEVAGAISVVLVVVRVGGLIISPVLTVCDLIGELICGEGL